MATTRLNKFTKGIDAVFFKHAIKVTGAEIYDYFEIPVKEVEAFLKEAKGFVKSERADERDRFIGRLITQIEKKKQPLTKEYLTKWLKEKRVTK